MTSSGVTSWAAAASAAYRATREEDAAWLVISSRRRGRSSYVEVTPLDLGEQRVGDHIVPPPGRLLVSSQQIGVCHVARLWCRFYHAVSLCARRKEPQVR